MSGLYIHIPYCVRKCLYCDFYSVATGGGSVSGRLTDPLPDNAEFMDALEREMASLPDGFAPSSIFIGGGTPTELSDGDFARLLGMVVERIDLRGVTEWTCESNPGTLTRAKTEMMRDAGLNRISLGVQSFDARTLEFLGRIHDADEAREGYALLREAGFTNINLDLIHSVPGCAPETHLADVREAIRLGPEHISCYALTFEEGTPLAALKAQGHVEETGDEESAAMYDATRRALCDAGYEHYEISNFAKPDRRCLHNLLYWRAGAYLGCGPSAHSHWNGKRSANVRDLRAYCSAWAKGERPTAFEERLDPEAKARETLVSALRCLDGVERDAFRDQTGFDYAELCRPEIRRFEDLGLLDANQDRLRLTDKGLYLSNTIFADLV